MQRTKFALTSPIGRHPPHRPCGFRMHCTYSISHFLPSGIPSPEVPRHGYQYQIFGSSPAALPCLGCEQSKDPTTRIAGSRHDNDNDSNRPERRTAAFSILPVVQQRKEKHADACLQPKSANRSMLARTADARFGLLCMHARQSIRVIVMPACV